MKLPKAEIDGNTAMQLWSTERSEYAKEQLVLSNIGIVGLVMKSLNLPTTDEDLFSVGVIGLVKAINTFDAEKGFKFSTYATHVIRNEILVTFRKRTVDIAFSLDDTVDFDESHGSLSEIIPDKMDIESEVIANVQYEDLLSRLSEKERTILVLTINGKTQKYISDLTGFSQPYISRIIKGVRKKYET